MVRKRNSTEFVKSLDACSKLISEETGLDRKCTDTVIQKIKDIIFACLLEEQPFTINDVCVLYFQYRQPIRSQVVKNLKLVKRKLFVKPVQDVENKLEKYVPDIGLKDNIDKKQMLKLKITPNEISDLKRIAILKQQRELSFDARLLYDNDKIPAFDKKLLESAPPIPTPDEIKKRLGFNLS